MRLSVIVLIAVLVVGGIVISLGFLSNEKYEVPEISNQYEKLERYKNELEKINQYNKQVLQELEEKIKNSDDANLEKINEELAVMRKVIDENAAELEQVIIKLSQMKSDP